MRDSTVEFDVFCQEKGAGFIPEELMIILYIMISAGAFHSAAWLQRYGNALNSPYWVVTSSGKKYLMIYTLSAIPIACLNGYLLGGWLGLFACGVLTFIGMSIPRLLLPGNGAIHLIIFGSANIIWTCINIF